MEDATKVKNFKSWMADVDRELESLCGLSSDDLADQCYMDWYEDGLSANEAAQEALDNQD
jgi:hypothetical protein